MKNLLLALFFTSCATLPKDEIALDLPKHVSNCMCLTQGGETDSSKINWKNKSEIKKKIQFCKCTLEITDFDDIEDPLDYIKPGTEFYSPTKLYPWEKEYRGPNLRIN